MTRYPLGSTWVTCAVRVVLRVVERVVAPWPFRADCVFRFAKLAKAPAALVGPPAAVMELLNVDWRCVLVVPCATAEACSETTIVRISLTWLARKSPPRFIKREVGAHKEPVGVCTLAVLAIAWLTY